MTPRTFSSILLAAAIAGPVVAAEVVTVTLVGGSRVTGPLLRRNDDGVVIDLGFEPLQIPAKKVLDVRAESPEEATGAVDCAAGAVL